MEEKKRLEDPQSWADDEIVNIIFDLLQEENKHDLFLGTYFYPSMVKLLTNNIEDGNMRKYLVRVLVYFHFNG